MFLLNNDKKQLEARGTRTWFNLAWHVRELSIVDRVLKMDCWQCEFREFQLPFRSTYPERRKQQEMKTIIYLNHFLN